jgi:hypothetical protein
VTAKEREHLTKLVSSCEAVLAHPIRQSINIFRGDMRAIVAASREIQRLQLKSDGQEPR